MSDITTSGFEITLELTFSYIVSLSVSEKVSGVAIFASKLAAREKNRVTWMVRVFEPRVLHVSATYGSVRRRLELKEPACKRLH